MPQDSSSSFQVTAIKVVNEAKVEGISIQTGVGFLDHMIDQWNSHAQVGVGIQVVSMAAADNNNDNANRLADQNQVELCTTVGSALGTELKAILDDAASKLAPSSNRTSRFCCPLDEALVECVIAPRQQDAAVGSLVEFTLAPYGIYPKGKGRTRIGTLETFAIESFWRALAETSGVQLSIRKLRGDNAHHIVESAFKAFSRALRNHLDPSDWFDPSGPNDQASIALRRDGTIERQTKETSISVRLQLNGTSRDTRVDTGIPMLNAFYTTLAQEAHMTLQICCEGDVWVDDHHTAEDVSIAVGQCLTQALGSKAGLNRMWVGSATTTVEDDSHSDQINRVEVTMDLSNRPCFVHNLHETLGRQEYVHDKCDDEEFAGMSLLSCEMLEHCLDSLVMNGRMTVHVVVVESHGNKDVADVVLCTAKAFGRALRVCAMVDERRHGKTASSKGTLSV
jgi:imidazoleglycerol-phosphate dehydratase